MLQKHLHFEGDDTQRILIGNYTNQDTDFRWDGDTNDNLDEVYLARTLSHQLDVYKHIVIYLPDSPDPLAEKGPFHFVLSLLRHRRLQSI